MYLLASFYLGPTWCIVPGCNKSAAQHAIPTNSNRKSLWLKALRLEGQDVKKYSKICTLHFKDTDYIDSEIDPINPIRRNLKKHAVPSIFSWNQESSQKQVEFIANDDISSTPDSESEKENLDPLLPLIGSASSATSITEKQSTPTTSDFESDCDMFIPFDASGITRTYSKSYPPIKFIPELPSLGSEEQFTTDPLGIEEDIEENVHIVEPDFEVGNNIEIAESDSEVENDMEMMRFVEIKTEENITSSTETNICESCGQNKIPAYSIHSYKTEANAVHFYTGLENFDKLMFVFYTLGNNVNNLNYYYGKPPSHLDALEMFCMTLLILRRHREFEDVAMTYKTSLKQVTNIFITWIRFMALQWRSIDLWLEKDAIQYYMPQDFNDKYPNTRAIIDATECPLKKPHLPTTQQITFSTYKNRNTIKFLVGMAPSGLIMYLSPCYGGSATDRQIIEQSSILHRFDTNDEIMVDKGLNVQDIFLSYGVKVNMPSFFKKGNQIKPSTLLKDRKIASKRVHVERIIGMLKTYKILKQPMNHTETLLSSDITYVVAMLVNFRSNIMNKNA